MLADGRYCNAIFAWGDVVAAGLGSLRAVSLCQATRRDKEVLEIFAEAKKICCETANKTLNNITNRVIHFVKEGNISKLSRKNMQWLHGLARRNRFRT